MGHVKDLKTGIKYKNTPIGKIPVDWEVTSIEKICNIKRGASPRPIGDPSFFSATGRGWIRISDVTTTYKYLRRTSQYLSEKGVSRSVKVEPGDLIMSICATIGKPILLGIEACIHDGFVLFSGLTQKVDSEFLFYLLQKVENKFTTKGQVGTQGNLNTGIVKKTILALPPIAEQKKIAEILTTVDQAIEKTEQIIEKSKETKKGLMQRLLTRGIGHKEFKKTEIGEIPEEWEVGEISNYGEILTGNTPPTNVPQYYGNEYPFVSPFDLGNKRIIRKTEKYLSKEGFAVARALPANSVLVVCIGSTIGKTGIAGTELATNQQINSIICKNSDYNFVYYYATFINQEFKQLAGTQAVPILNKGNFSKVKVAIPPLSEQKEIGGKLSAINDEIEKESNHKEQLELLKKGLMQVLLTGKIRVSSGQPGGLPKIQGDPSGRPYELDFI
jgi:type I restriction enzyme S subunit